MASRAPERSGGSAERTGTSTEHRVIDGARRAIATGGWQAATLTRIAEEAGRVADDAAPPGPRPRRDLRAARARLRGRLPRRALADGHGQGTGAERLEAMLVAVCEVTEDHLDFLAALDEEADRRFFHESDDEVHSREGYITPIERLLADGIADGSIRAGRDRGDGDGARQRVDRTYRHLRRAHDWDPDALARGADRPGAPRAAAALSAYARGNGGAA